MTKKTPPPQLKPKPKLFRVLLTASIGLAVIGMVAICIGLFASQASTLIIGFVLVTVAMVLGLVFANLLFPRKRR